MTARLEDATRSFYDALNEVLQGDPKVMEDLWSHADDITYMSPFGELLVGWEQVRASWAAQAQAHLGGQVMPEDVHYFTSDSLGFAVGFERGQIELNGVSTPVDIRATSMFRLEDGRWSMIGHHTDPI